MASSVQRPYFALSPALPQRCSTARSPDTCLTIWHFHNRIPDRKIRSFLLLSPSQHLLSGILAYCSKIQYTQNNLTYIIPDYQVKYKLFPIVFSYGDIKVLNRCNQQDTLSLNTKMAGIAPRRMYKPITKMILKIQLKRLFVIVPYSTLHIYLSFLL